MRGNSICRTPVWPANQLTIGQEAGFERLKEGAQRTHASRSEVAAPAVRNEALKLKPGVYGTSCAAV